MSDQFSSNYDVVTCSKCGASNSVTLTHCRKCDADLTKSGAFTIPVWMVVAAIGLLGTITCAIVAGMLVEDANGIFGMLFAVIGIILMTIGYFWLLIAAFLDNPLWGIGMLFFYPITGLAFLVIRTDKALKPLLTYVAGLVMVGIGVLLMPADFFQM